MICVDCSTVGFAMFEGFYVFFTFFSCFVVSSIDCFHVVLFLDFMGFQPWMFQVFGSFTGLWFLEFVSKVS